MRTATRNKSVFWFARYSGKEDILDEYGNSTGEYTIRYDEPAKCFGSVSAAKGEASIQQFGADVSYDKVILLDDPSIPIDEHCILWVDKVYSADTTHDYIVKKVAKSRNFLVIAISGVDVNA